MGGDDMKFSITDRTLMKMLFERGTVSEVGGVSKVGRFERIWNVRHLPKTNMHEDYFSGIICGVYDKMAIADTLDECLSQLEAIIEEESK
jgi:hypothetical protein